MIVGANLTQCFLNYRRNTLYNQTAIPIVKQLLSSHHTVASGTVRNLCIVKAAPYSRMFLSYELHI